MSNNLELVNRLMDEYRGKHLTLTTEEIRSIVENVIEETKKHIAKSLVERYANLFEHLVPHNAESLEDYLNESLEAL